MGPIENKKRGSRWDEYANLLSWNMGGQVGPIEKKYRGVGGIG